MSDVRHLDPVRDAQLIIELVEQTGLSYLHGSGCAILRDGTWIQPEQWSVWINFLEQELAA